MFKYILLSISETERERGGETVREGRREGDIEDGWKGGHNTTGLQIYGGPGSLSHNFKIWPITFRGRGPSGPILFSCEKISL